MGLTYESDGLIAHCDLTIEVQDMGPDKYRTGKQFHGNLSFFLFRSKPPSQSHKAERTIAGLDEKISVGIDIGC